MALATVCTPVASSVFDEESCLWRFASSDGPPYAQADTGCDWPVQVCIILLYGSLDHANRDIRYVGSDEEETGWKYIHGDVFRFPPQKSLFSACVGTGTQILVMATAIFMLSLVGVFYPYNRGALLSACVVGFLRLITYVAILPRLVPIRTVLHGALGHHVQQLAVFC